MGRRRCFTRSIHNEYPPLPSLTYLYTRRLRVKYVAREGDSIELSAGKEDSSKPGNLISKSTAKNYYHRYYRLRSMQLTWNSWKEFALFPASFRFLLLSRCSINHELMTPSIRFADRNVICLVAFDRFFSFVISFASILLSSFFFSFFCQRGDFSSSIDPTHTQLSRVLARSRG